MKSKTTRRALTISCAIVLLCMTIIVGVSYALFTDSKRMSNHLRAGDLEVSLTRTSLEYSILDADGKLAVAKDDQTVDFTEITQENVFGVTSERIFIAPGSFFKATMQVANIGNVAFTYDVGIQLANESNALAEQLQVIITRADGTSVSTTLSELADGATIQGGELLAGANSQSFTVEVRFIDDTSINNAAQTQLSVFDLYVNAVQATGNP